MLGYGAPTGWLPDRFPLDEDTPPKPWNAYALSKHLAEQTIAMLARADRRRDAVRRLPTLLRDRARGVGGRADPAGPHRRASASTTPALSAPALFNYVDARDVASFIDVLLDALPAIPNAEVFFVGADDALAREPLAELLPRFVPGTEALAAGLTGTSPGLLQRQGAAAARLAPAPHLARRTAADLADRPDPKGRAGMDFDGILFFPVTPFDAGRPHRRRPAARARLHDPRPRARRRLPGLRHRRVPRPVGRRGGAASCASRPRRSAGRVPVVAGTGGPLGHATAVARAAADAGADALLVLPPYLVGGPQAGLVAYVEAVAAASDLPVVDLPPRHRAVLRRLGAPARREPGSSASRTASATSGSPSRSCRAVAADGPRRLRVLQRPADRGADAGRVPRHRHPAVLVGGVRDGPRDRERLLPRLRRRRRGPPRSCSTASTARSCACATRRRASASRSSRRGCACRASRSAACAPPLVDPTPEQEERLAGILEAGTRAAVTDDLVARRTADPRAADAAVGRGCHVGRRHRDARRALRRRRGMGLLVDAADRRRGRARAHRARHRAGRDRARRRPRDRLAAAVAAPARGGRRRDHDDRARRDSTLRCGMPRPARSGSSLSTLLGRRRSSVRAYGSGVNLHYPLEDLVAQVRAVGRRGLRRREDQGRQARPARGPRARRRGARRARAGPRAHDRREPALGPRDRDARDRRPVGLLAGLDRGAAARRRPHRPHRARAPDRRADRASARTCTPPTASRSSCAPAPRRSCSPTSCASAGSRPFRRIADVAADHGATLHPHLLPELSGQLALTLPVGAGAAEPMAEDVEDAAFGALGALDGPVARRASPTAR